MAIPWKDLCQRTRSNFPGAKLFFQQLEQRFWFNPDLRRAYGWVVDDWLKNGYVQQLDLDHNEDQYFVPHFPVLRLDKAST